MRLESRCHQEASLLPGERSRGKLGEICNLNNGEHLRGCEFIPKQRSVSLVFSEYALRFSDTICKVCG